MRILAAIVTYNRMALLERCIRHVRAQTRAPDALLVINNSSPDRTVEMLEREDVDYVTQPNLGSAGGWNRAIGAALEGGFDAVWLMDDDGYPAPDALGYLEAALQPEVALVSSVVLNEDKPTHFVFPFAALGKDGLPVLFAWRRKIYRLDQLSRMIDGDTYPIAHLFNGALLSTEVARRVGNVDTRFFLMGDEIDYFMRIRREGAVVSHIHAHHLHPDVSGRPLDPRKVYYFVKNSIILHGRYYGHPTLRNLTAVAAVILRVARRNSVGEAISYVMGKRAPILWRAIVRGFRGNLGQDFNG